MLIHEECGLSIMSRTFSGEIRETKICQDCQHDYSANISFEYLSMPSVVTYSSRIPFIVNIYNQNERPIKHIYYTQNENTLLDVSYTIFKQC